MTTRIFLTAAAAMCVAAGTALAQYDSTKQPPKPATPTAPKTDKPAPGMPSQDQMNEMMEQAAKPGPNHQLLNGMVGDWTCDCTFWMAPGAPPMQSKGTATNKWTLGNRFVSQEFNGTFMDKPFHGMGYTGYDNQKQKFVGSWMDTASTGIMYSEGTYDAGSKTFTFTASCTDPTGKPSTMTEVIKIIDENTHTFTMSGNMDGKEMKMGEITYHRKGAKPMDSDAAKPMDNKPATPAPKPTR